MAKYPSAVWDEISGPSGTYLNGPFKIVHHTTEGNNYASARAVFAANRSDPHFTVEGTTVYQHIDTGQAARSLRNNPGGVETNRDSAVQIEVVGHAGSSKDAATLATVAKLCRWIEAQHGIPQAWPNGFVRWSHSGGDPGGHNRDSMSWDRQAGHYGHSQVPENTHWDPAYTPAETQLVTPGAAHPDALFRNLQLATGWTAPGTPSSEPAPYLQLMAESTIQRMRSVLTNATVKVFPGGVGRIEVRIENGLSKVEVCVVGSNEQPSTRASKKRKPRRRAKRNRSQ